LFSLRFDSVSGAQLFRREGVKLAKAQHDEFKALFFSNSVTQSTRVRIEILRELSKKLTTTTEVAFVQGFVSRPVIQYRVREGERSRADGVGRSYTFVDAMAKFGRKLAQKDLGTAYVRAGSTFDGALSQYFVVLKDDLAARILTGMNRLAIGQRGGVRSRSRGGSTFRSSRGTPTPFRGLKRPVEVDVVADDSDLEAGPSKKQEQEHDEMDVTLIASE
jgi:hypothetical protein